MGKRHALVWAILVILTVTVVTGCGSLSQYFGGKWVAVVNGQKLSLDDFNNRLNKTELYYKQQGMDFTSAQGKQMLDSIKKQVLDDMVTEALVMQQAQKDNLVVNDNEINAQIASIKNNFGSDSQYQAALKSQNMTESDLQQYIKVELTSKTLYDKVTTGITVTDADVLNYYNQNKSKYVQPEEVKASQILVKTQAEAEDIIKQLNAGANFAQLAKEKSIDTGSKANGGELGYFTRGQMVQEFENAAFSQKVGTYSQTPVKTQYGYHIILVEDHKQAVQQTFDQVKGQIKQQLPQTEKDAKFQQYLANLKKQAKIEYAPDFVAIENLPSTGK